MPHSSRSRARRAAERHRQRRRCRADVDLPGRARRGDLAQQAGLGTWPKAAPSTSARTTAGRYRKVCCALWVPAAPTKWIKALEQYGTMTFSDVAEGAIRFARDGFRDVSADVRRHGHLHGTTAGGHRRRRSTFRTDVRPGRRSVRAIGSGAQSSVRVRPGKGPFRQGPAGGPAGGARHLVRRRHRRSFSISHEVSQNSRSTWNIMTLSYKTTRLTCSAWCQGPSLAQAFKLVEGIDLRGARA